MGKRKLHPPHQVPITAFGISEPYHDQRRFIVSNAPNVYWCAGRGTGKTTGLIVRCLRESLRPVNKGLAHLLCAPTYRQLVRSHERLLQRCLQAFSDHEGYSLLKRHYRADHIYVLRNGSEIWCQSFERSGGDRVRSMTAASAAIDEIEMAGVGGGDAFHTAGTIAAAVRGPGSLSVSYTSTPRGLRGVLRKFVEAVEADPPDESHQLITSTSLDNPYLTQAFFDRLKASMSAAAYRQEVLAAITRVAHLVWAGGAEGEGWERSRHVVPFAYTGQPYQVWVDPGYSHPYVSWWAEVETDDGTHMVCFAEFCEDDVPEQQLVRVIGDQAAQLKQDPTLVVSDRALPRFNSMLMRQFPNTRLKTMKSHSEQRIASGVEVVRACLSPLEGPPVIYIAEQLLKTPSERGIIKSIEGLRRVVKAGVVTDAIPRNDWCSHATDALRMGCVANFGKRKAFFHMDGGAGVRERRLASYGR